MSSTQLKIVDTAICPVGRLKGYEGDAQRANLLSDGRILSGLSGYSQPIGEQAQNIFQQPQFVRNVTAELISSSVASDPTLALVSCRNQLEGRDLLGELGGSLALNGFGDASVLDNERLAFAAKTPGGGLLASLSYNNGTVNAALALNVPPLDGKDHDAVETLTQSGQTAALLAVKKLLDSGFRVTMCDSTHVLLRRGNVAANLSVEIHYRW